ncbi:MAG: hypothetical protein L6Q26_12125 [Anaerolineales bacterium]|nr:hypothetical protein [Anaerolineales bacterium]
MFPPTHADAFPPADSDTTDGDSSDTNPYIHSNRHTDHYTHRWSLHK